MAAAFRFTVFILKAWIWKYVKPILIMFTTIDSMQPWWPGGTGGDSFPPGLPQESRLQFEEDEWSHEGISKCEL